MTRGTGDTTLSLRLKVVAQLWCLGCFESLQLQRCVVLCVLDKSGQILGKVIKCFVINGIIFLGSILWSRHVVHPVVMWLLVQQQTSPYGKLAASSLETMLTVAFHVFWLLPAYFITLIVSCIWYQDIANVAYQVKQQHDLQQQIQPSTVSRSKTQSIEGIAQELYRVIFFLVFYTEVWLISNIPYAGPVANFIFLSWLYAYYCYDYKWSLQGIKLPERIAFFERRWAFFAGFGAPCTLATIFLSFYVGAAVTNILFPLFILVACFSDPSKPIGAIQAGTSIGQIQIFKIALWPTDRVVARLFGSSKGPKKSNTR